MNIFEIKQIDERRKKRLLTDWDKKMKQKKITENIKHRTNKKNKRSGFSQNIIMSKTNQQLSSKNSKQNNNKHNRKQKTSN